MDIKELINGGWRSWLARVALALVMMTTPLAAEVASVADVEKLPADTKSVKCSVVVADDAMAALAKRADLEELDLYHCREITVAGLAHLTGLKKLRVLNLDMCRQLEDSALVEIGKLTSLEHLNLHQGVNYTDNGIKALGTLVVLRELNIGMFWKASPAALETVLALPMLEALELRLNQWVDDDALKAIAEKKPELKKLNLRECRGYKIAGFRQIARLSKLTWLDIGGYREFGVEVLDELAKLENLEHLDLIQSYKLRDADLPHLGKCAKLRFLGLEGLIFLSGECFDEWQPPALERLELKLNELTPAGIRCVTKLQSLRELYIWDPIDSLTDEAALKAIVEIKGLKLLSLWCATVSDETAESLSHLPELEHLHIGASEALTDSGVAALAGLKKAKRIEIMSCDKVSKDAISKLRQALPGCTVVDEIEE